MVLQMMETELGGEQVYRTAPTRAVNPDPKGRMGRLSARNPDPPDSGAAACATPWADPDTQSPTRGWSSTVESRWSKPCSWQTGGDPAAPSWWLGMHGAMQKPKTTPTGSCWAGGPKWPRAIWAGPESSPRSGGKRRRPPPATTRLVPRTGHRGPGPAASESCRRPKRSRT